MRKISQEAYQAFKNKKKWKKDNTRVFFLESGESIMTLFGRGIAKEINGELYISNGGYIGTNTTRDRLNAFPNVSIRRKGTTLIVNEKIELSKEWLNINELYER